MLRIESALTNTTNVDNNLYFKTSGTNENAVYYDPANKALDIKGLQALGLAVHGLYGDPKLDANFKPQSTSPGIDAGATLGNSIFTWDKGGVARPQGNGFDIGAYEFSQISTGSTGVTVNTKIFLQGAYENGIMNDVVAKNGVLPADEPFNKAPWNYNGSEKVTSAPQNSVDWVLLELRSEAAASSIVAERAALINNDGKIVDLDGSSPVKFDNVENGSYYIVIRHRNHLAVMSAKKVNLSSNSELYDFTTSANQAYGNDPTVDLGNGVFGMYGGDGDHNGVINVLDYGSVGSSMFKSGYENGDLDLNNTVNVLDYKETSSALFKSSQVPK